MKKLLLASAATLAAGAVSAEEIKLGVILAFTGPLESVTPNMATTVDLVAKEVSDSGKFLNGTTVSTVRADTGCIDAALATASAERLITSEGIKGIIGGMCSGETGAQLTNVAVPNGMVMISPSATSPGLTTIEDRGLFFRTSPSDARQGEVMADIILERGLKTVAVTYTNNDYGKGLADSFAAAFTAKGGTVTINTPHEDNKADYTADVAALDAAGGEALVVAGYSDLGGSGVIRAALDSGAFDTFVLPDGMVGEKIVENFGSQIDGSFGQNPAASGDGPARFNEIASAAGFDGSSTFAAQSYDATALMLLAMQAAGSTDPQSYKDKVMEVANAPGEKIYPGELAKALELLAAGTDIDYVGASSVELIGPGETAGSFREIEIKDGKMTEVGFR